jgi:hypothetical protein
MPRPTASHRSSLRSSSVARGLLSALAVAGAAALGCDTTAGREQGTVGSAPGGDDGKFDHDGQDTAPICRAFSEHFCAEDEASCGWDWRQGYIALDCSLMHGDRAGYVNDPVLLEEREALLGELAVFGEDASPGIGRARKCAVLEQARQLCADGSATPRVTLEIPEQQRGDDGWEGLAERLQTRTASCHPGALFDCHPYVPDYASIRSKMKDPTIFGAAVQELSQEATYCTGQVVGDLGYATTIPRYSTLDQTTTPWTCSEEEAQAGAFDSALAEHGGTILGYDAASLLNLECPLRKALVECVAPNLGDAEACELYIATGAAVSGTRYPGVSADYCFSIVVGRRSDGDSAHSEGRAIDLNNNVSGHLNSGNIAGCIGDHNKQTKGESCTNAFVTARVDLAPEFVAVMEGCGFQWLGRASNAEGGAFGCDPMHFELDL